MLPGPDETHLLRSILHRGPSAPAAWDAFRGPERDLPSLFRTDTGNRKRLAPLLLASIRENRLEADPGLLTVLRTATLREELRVDAYRRIARHAYTALLEASIPFTVIRGAVLMETTYSDPAWRHAHDIDLLLPDAALDGASEALRRAGFADAPALDGDHGLQMRHSTDLPVLLLRRLFRIPFYRGDYADVAARHLTWSMDGVGTLRRPDATDALLLALVHAAYCGGRTSLVWAVDAWMLLHADETVDWAALEERTRRTRAELPVATLLAYLERELDAPVPASLPEQLTRGTDGARGMRRDVALSGIRRARGDHPDLERRAPMPIGHRWTRLLWELFPSREYLAWAHDDPPPALLPLLYLTRPVTALIERLRSRVIRARRRR
jgi:hypothetical protein